MAKFVELSHEIVEGMKTYPGLPEPRVELFCTHESSRARYQDQAEFLIANLHCCGNTGTYVDSPYHRYRDGIDLADLPLARLADLEFVLVDVRRHTARGIGPESFPPLDLKGKAVLILTGWSRHWGTGEYFSPNPFLTAGACHHLVAEGAVFAGIDSVNIDDMQDLSRPAHTILLGAGIPVCEHMTNLEALLGSGGRLHAVPIPWRRGATFAVRAYVVC